MITSTIRADDNGNPIFTLTVGGVHDLARIADHLAVGGTDLTPHSRRIVRHLQAALGVEQTRAVFGEAANGVTG